MVNVTHWLKKWMVRVIKVRMTSFYTDEKKTLNKEVYRWRVKEW